MNARRSMRGAEGMALKKKTVDAARPAAGKIRARQKKSNLSLNAQTRKVLGQHYRAKYGVK
jgi:hypothetical protein